MVKIGNLIVLADEYIRATCVKDVTLSFWVFNDSKKLSALRNGSDMYVGRYNAALGWFSVNWPKGVEWPAGVPRHSSERAA